MDFEIYSPLLSIVKLCIALGFFCFIGWLMDYALGFDLEAAIDALEKNANEGSALPLAIVLATLIFTIGGILERFI